LIRTPGDEAVVCRVRVDLRAFGWRIIEVPIQDTATPHESLAQWASEYSAVAALRVDAALGQIEIHIERPWGNVYEILRNEDGPIDAQILALRTTEALRAHGLDSGPAAARVAQDQTSSPAPNQGVRSTAVSRSLVRAQALSTTTQTKPGNRAETTVQKGLWLQLAPATTASPGGLGIGFAALLGARFEISPRWSVAANGLVPLTSRLASAPEGSAHVATSLVGFAVEGTWLRHSHWFCTSGLGLALLWTVAEGWDAQTGYAKTYDTTSTTAPQFHLRTGLQLSRDWSAFGMLLGGVSFPEVRVLFADHEARTWGQPYTILSLGVELRTITW
jgi:hypothetical protein